MQLNQSQRFDNLDIVRFVLAYLLIIFHAYFGWKENFGSPSFVLNQAGNSFSRTGLYIERFIHNISLSGDIFFLISAFLITIMLLREQDASGDIRIRSFYIKRGMRILPLYFLILAFSPLLTMMMNEKMPDYTYWVLLVGNIDLANNGWGSLSINYLWFITILLQFYIVIPIVLVIIRRKYLPLFFTFVIFISFVFRIYAYNSANPWQMIYLHTMSRMDVLAIGSWLGLLYHQRKNFVLLNSLPMRLMIYFVLLYLMCVDEYTDYNNIFFATTKKYFYLMIVSYILANYLFNPSARLVPKKRNALNYLGMLTFGIYLFSNLGIALMIHLCKVYPDVKNFWLYLLALNVIVIPAAMLSYHFIEIPLKNLRNRFLKSEVIQKTEQA